MPENTESQYPHGTSYEISANGSAAMLQEISEQWDRLSTVKYVLDLGCGAGRFNAVKLNRSFSVIGVDNNPDAIVAANELIASHNLPDEAVVGDITDLSFLGGGKVDGAISWRVLHTLVHDDLQVSLAQVHNALRDQASFHLAVASDRDWKLQKLYEGGSYDEDDGGLVECAGVMGLDHSFKMHFFSEPGILRTVLESGFDVFNVDYFEEPSGFGHLSGKLNSYIHLTLRT